jgi:excisionase family DNA binding protein
VVSARPILFEDNEIVLLHACVRSVLKTTRFARTGAAQTLVALDDRLARAVAEAASDAVAEQEPRSDAAVQVPVLTAAEAAAVMGCSSQYVRRLCQLGRLPARRTSAGWLVTVPVDAAS